jgi:Concanavalin A-like lectin/glucanases superfamily
MLNKKLNGSTAQPSDPYFENVSLLLTGDGTNGAQNNTFLDSSPNNFTITRNGNTTQGTFSPYGNLWSNYFDGSGDYLVTPSNAAFNPGSGDFTVELWFNCVSATTAGLFSTYTGSSAGVGILVRILADRTIAVRFGTDSGGGSFDAIAPATTFNINVWNHVAVVRQGNTLALWLNGSRLGTTTTSRTATTTIANIGNYYIDSSSLNFNGYISNVRFVKGTALYNTSDTTITIPTTPLTAVSGTSLLTCQSNRFIDNSSNNFAITVNGNTSVQRFSPFNPTSPYSTSTIGGSGYFDGSGDYLTAPSNTAWDFGTGAFTIESFVYIAGNSASNGSSSRAACVAATLNTGSSAQANGWAFVINGSSTTTGTGLFLEVWASGSIYSVSATATIPQNSWNHVAVVRSGTTTTFYLNGVSIGSGTLSNQNVNSDYPIYLGGTLVTNYTNNLNGYLSNTRIVNGTALYTSNFTPPTAPLTAITNTSLLCNMANAGIYDAAMMNDLETVGNAQVSTSVKKYGTGSLAFDGTDDCLKMPASPNLWMGSGNFTVEGWTYQTAISNEPFNTGLGKTIISFGWTYGGSNVSWFIQQSANSYTINMSSNGSSWDIGSITAGIAISPNVWNHFAVVRSGSTVSIFVNGVKSSNTITTTASLFNSANPVTIGSDNALQVEFNGYIADLRITKGYARYTSNFTPPAQALPNQ